MLASQSTKEEIQTAINSALEIGYRHFDCAYNYLNEEAIGEVLHDWISAGKVKREDLFIVTKVYARLASASNCFTDRFID